MLSHKDARAAHRSDTKAEQRCYRRTYMSIGRDI